MCMADRKRKKVKYYRPHFVLHFFAILLGYIILLLPLSASCFASGSVFHFSKGISSFERDGSACQEMELLDRGVPVACGAVQIEEAWCQYRFRQRKAEPQETRGRQGTFEAAAVKIEPFARDERWVIRVSSPITVVCNVLMRLRSGGRQYVVQRQFTLYGRGWQSDAWKEALTKRAAFYGHFTLPYLSFENLRNFYRGETITGWYKNWAEAEEGGKSSVFPVEIFSEGREQEGRIITEDGGKLCYRLPLSEPLEASVWRKGKSMVFTAPARYGQSPVLLFTQVDFNDNYYAYDNIPQGIVVMGIFAALTATAILLWQRRPSYHGY